MTTKRELRILLCIIGAICLGAAIAFSLHGCAVDPWPDPKADAWWGTTSTPAKSAP